MRWRLGRATVVVVVTKVEGRRLVQEGETEEGRVAELKGTGSWFFQVRRPKTLPLLLE